MRPSCSGGPFYAAGCDTMVALAEAALRGRTLFAKNSDRPPGECQPLALLERATHAAGTSVRCQYIAIPQVRETARVLGSRPMWLWGFEHGVNEHGVAIGNETIFGPEAPGPLGLLGMDLVRLGLERSASADEAVAILIELIETHGQGGSGFREFEFPYNNSFLIADPRQAWILEALGRTWAARRCRATDSISNHVSIGADWDRISDGAAGWARELGFPDATPLDFSRFRDRERIPPAMSEGRLRRSRSLLAQASGEVTVETLREVLRDHDATGRRFVRGAAPDDEQYHTICMHQGVSRTAASVIAELDADRRGPQSAWISFGRPCASVFFPVLAAGTLPPSLCEGSEQPSDALWWVFERIAQTVEEDPTAASRVRDTFDALEADLVRAWEDARPSLEQSGWTGNEAAATEFMAEVAARVEAEARRLLAAC
jgi:secernin